MPTRSSVVDSPYRGFIDPGCDSASGRNQAIIMRAADVVVANFVPGAPARLGCDYAVLSAVKPDLLWRPASGLIGCEYPPVPGQTEPESPASAATPAAVRFAALDTLRRAEGE
jgi:CoA-transferase family III